MKAGRDSSQFGLKAFWIIVVTTILGFCYSMMVVFISPKKYESSVVVELRSGKAQEEVDLPTEVAVLTSGETMKEVAKSLSLSRRWSMEGDDVNRALLEIVEAEQVEDTNLVEVRVQHANIDDAWEIAADIPKSHLRRLKADRDAAFDKRFWKLDEMIQEKNEVLALQEEALGEIARSLGLEFGGRESVQSVLQSIPEEVRKRQVEKVAEFRKAHQEYEETENSLAAFRDERTKTQLELAQIFEPVKVHTEAKRAQEASAPDVESGLLWGAGKGLIFGILLSLVAYFSLKSSGSKDDDPLVVGAGKGSPADLW